MKTTLIAIACFFAFIIRSDGQARPPDTIPANAVPPVYIGLGVGANNYCGIVGIGADIRLVHTLFLRCGAGIGSWGSKVGIGLRYALDYSGGWVFGATYEYCSGLKNFSTPLQVDSAGTTMTKTVNMNLLSTGTLNLTASYAWVFHKTDDFFLEFGYAVPLQSSPYAVTDGSILTASSKSVMNLTTPGGIIVSLGLMFGL